uniref:Uncharacterized protein n=1 Tax=Arundo donax TaxID=35708 RepID=A0A0A9BWN0_ARUDO
MSIQSARSSMLPSCRFRTAPPFETP